MPMIFSFVKVFNCKDGYEFINVMGLEPPHSNKTHKLFFIQ